MSTKAFLRSALAATIVLAAACSETLAPTLERIQAQIANITCEVTWTGAAGDRMWQTPGNWAPPAVPTATQDVCITGDGNYVELFGDASVKSLTIGAPGSANPAWLAVRGLRVGTGWYNLPANLNVANGIENFGRLTMDATGLGPGAVTINVTGGTLQNSGRFSTLSKDFGVNGGDLVHYVNANVVNDGLMDFYASTEMTGTWTNRGAVKFTQAANGFDMPYFYTLTNGTWDQVSGGLNVSGTFEIRDGLLKLLQCEFIGSEGPILLRGALAIADNAHMTSGNITLRQNVALSGNVPEGLTLIMAGHAYSTTGFFIPTVVTAANGFVNKGTLRLISTGHSMGTPATLNVANGVLDNYGRIESAVGNFNSSGRFINASLTNRAGAIIDIRSGTEFNKPGAVYENSGTITVTPSTFVTLNGAPSFLQNGALTLGTDAQWKQDRGNFRLAGGAITGRPWIAGTTFDIPAGSPATGTLRLTHITTFSGDVPAGVKLHVEATREFQAPEGLLNAGASYTNFGTIVVGDPGFNPTPTRVVMLNGATLTNKGRIETVFDPAGGHRYITGNFTNEGTLQLDNWTQFAGGTVRSIAPATVTMGPTGQGLFDLQPGATLHASGSWAVQLVNRGHLFIGTPNTAASLSLKEYGGANGSQVTMDIGGSPSAPGADFDRMTMTGPMTFSPTLNVRALNGACIDGGTSYDVISYSHPSGNFSNFTGLDLGGGRTVQPVQLSSSYRLNVVGPLCPPPDATPPVIAANVSGTQGNNGWYTSDVTVTWTVTDAESPVSSKTGCELVSVTSDQSATTYTCSATSAGGSASESVTIKRDATPPTWTQTRSAQPNANGWYNADVTVTLHGADAMSGLANLADVPYTASAEGTGRGFTNGFVDNAGNGVLAVVNDINLDKTAPVVTVTRSPLPDASGWNNTNVTATWSASDALSGIDGSATATHLFDQDGAGQSATRSFSDKAGNSASATISAININKTPEPPPPPPTLSPVCSATPSEIWSPNNKMVAVRVTVGGSGVTSFRLRSVTNNETGSADVEGWTLGTADVDGSVLAKRLGGGNGRTYTLTYDVFGAGGATGSCAVTVRVPHDQRGR